MKASTVAIIKAHEGFRQFPYLDTVGKLTIGYGFNLDDVGLSEEESEMILIHRLNEKHRQLMKFDWYKNQCPERQTALLDMTYNLGIGGIQKFRKMIRALSVGDFKEAAIQALDSKWAGQVGRRANFIADILETGRIQ